MAHYMRAADNPHKLEVAVAFPETTEEQFLDRMEKCERVLFLTEQNFKESAIHPSEELLWIHRILLVEY